MVQYLTCSNHRLQRMETNNYWDITGAPDQLPQLPQEITIELWQKKNTKITSTLLRTYFYLIHQSKPTTQWKKNIIKIILFLLIAGCISFASYNAGKSTVYSQDYEYYEKTEALLDSINNWDNSFMDTVMETDAYYEYEVAKQNIQ